MLLPTLLEIKPTSCIRTKVPEANFFVVLQNLVLPFVKIIAMGLPATDLHLENGPASQILALD